MLALSFVDRDFACLDEADGSSQFAAYLFGVLHTLEELGNPALGLLLAALVVKGRQSTACSKLEDTSGYDGSSPDKPTYNIHLAGPNDSAERQVYSLRQRSVLRPLGRSSSI